MPAAKVDEAEQRDGVPYRQYISRGILRTSGEHFVDYHDVFAWAAELVDKYEISRSGPATTGTARSI